MSNHTREMHSQEYDREVEAEMKKMEEEGIWKMVAREEDGTNRKGIEATIFAFQIL